jgi:exopolysaccharide biosynthesis polyprenyl glycosylphosphotransferase
MKNNASLVYGFFLVVGDFLALVAAFVSAYVIRVKLDTRPILAQGFSGEDYLKTLLLLLPFWLLIFGLLGLYNKDTYENRFSEFGRLLIGSFIGILFVIGYAYIVQEEVFPTRLIMAYALLLAFFFVLLFRTIARGIRRSLFHYGIGVSNVLIVGSSAVTHEFVESLADTRVTGYRIVGIVGSADSPNKYRHFTNFEEAVASLKKVGIHSIIQTELYASGEKNSDLLAFAQKNHISYRFVPGNSELFSGNIDVDLFYSIPVIAVHQTALIGWGRIVKRLFDIGFSLFSLIILSPLFLLLVLVSKITDPKCSVFFKQTRLTRFNREFRVYKFRSMHSEYGKGTPEEDFILMGRPELAKQFRENKEHFENDPRLTPIGRFLRATSLDELPQLYNVLKGDISLVGPRALIPQELKEYKQRHAILSVKSGLTGLAQISGRKDISFDERRKLDLFYVQNWSFWGDIVIILRTFSVVLFHRGAK